MKLRMLALWMNLNLLVCKSLTHTSCRSICNSNIGLLDQWLIEGKFTEEEALFLSCDMLAAGIDTVGFCNRLISMQLYTSLS